MLRYIVVLNVIFAVTWAASIPVPLKSLSDTVCSENAILNTTVVCRDVAAMKPSNVTLNKEFENLCEHAVDLLLKVCEHTLSDIKLSEEVEENVTRLFRPKVPVDEEFCHSLHKSQTDYKANAETFRFGSCVDKCVLPSKQTETMKPLCMFMQWSWKFLFDHSIGSQESAAPVEVVTVKDDKAHTATSKMSESNSGVAKDSPKEDQESGLPQPIQTTQKKDEHEKNIPSNVASPPSPPETGKGKKAEPVENPTPKASELPASQLNPPSEHIDEESLDGGKLPKISETQGKGSTANPEDHVKTNQDPTNIEDDDNQSEVENPGAGEDLNHQKPLSSDQKNGKELKEGSEDDLEGEAPVIGDPDTEDEEKSKEPAWPKMSNVESKERLTAKMDDLSEAEDSHFFVFFFIATFICILFYLIYQNKRKIIAMALEGKKGRHTGRRRPTSASYQKLDNKLDEVMASSPPPSKTHVIY